MVRAEGADPLPRTVSLTVKYPFFWTSRLSFLANCALGDMSNIFEVESLHGEHKVDVWFVHKQYEVECL